MRLRAGLRRSDGPREAMNDIRLIKNGPHRRGSGEHRRDLRSRSARWHLRAFRRRRRGLARLKEHGAGMKRLREPAGDAPSARWRDRRSSTAFQRLRAEIDAQRPRIGSCRRPISVSEAPWRLRSLFEVRDDRISASDDQPQGHGRPAGSVGERLELVSAGSPPAAPRGQPGARRGARRGRCGCCSGQRGGCAGRGACSRSTYAVTSADARRTEMLAWIEGLLTPATTSQRGAAGSAGGSWRAIDRVAGAKAGGPARTSRGTASSSTEPACAAARTTGRPEAVTDASTVQGRSRRDV